jgi:hypothetical protein
LRKLVSGKVYDNLALTRVGRSRRALVENKLELEAQLVAVKSTKTLQAIIGDKAGNFRKEFQVTCDFPTVEDFRKP